MILDKRPRALIFAAFFCLAAALGGGARAAEVYPGCAQPGPTGKVWWVDPVNGKTPADGGEWLPGASLEQPQRGDQQPVVVEWRPEGFWLHAAAAFEHPLSSRC